MTKPVAVRKAGAENAPAIAAMLGSYIEECYTTNWGGNAEQLANDILSDRVSLFVAEGGDKIIGFAAVIAAYDLHWCTRGGEVIDLYVIPDRRGRGIAFQVLAAAAKYIYENGGKFLKGGAIENVPVRRSVQRAAMMSGNGEVYLSGRAFRHFVGLAGRSPRDMLRNMPNPSWNLE